MIDKQSDVSRIVERLRKGELLHRDSCPTDRRAVNVVISQKGLDLLHNIDPHIDTLTQLNNLTDEEANTLAGLIEKIL